MMATPPKIKKARRHKIRLRSGHILETGWHFGRQKYVTILWSLNGNYAKEFYGTTQREVLTGIRLEIAKIVNPEVGEVAHRMGHRPGVISVETLMEMKHKMLEPGASKQGTWFLSPKIEQEIIKQIGHVPTLNGNPTFMGHPIVTTSELKTGAFFTDIKLEIEGDDDEIKLEIKGDEDE